MILYHASIQIPAQQKGRDTNSLQRGTKDYLFWWAALNYRKQTKLISQSFIDSSFSFLMHHLLKRFLLGSCQRDSFTLETLTRKAGMLLSPRRKRVSRRGEEEGLFVEKTLIFKRGKQSDVLVVDGKAEIWIETASGICFSVVSWK